MIEAYYLDSGGGYHECAHMLKLIKLYTEKFINFIICKLYSISKEYLLEFCKNWVKVKSRQTLLEKLLSQELSQ